MTIGPALPIGDLVRRVRQGQVAIVFFDTGTDFGHFSTLVGVAGRRPILPYTNRGTMGVRTFQSRWTAPGICRQCVFVRRRPTAPERVR